MILSFPPKLIYSSQRHGDNQSRNTYNIKNANESEFTHIALPIMHGQTPNDRSDSVINVETSELQQRQHEQPVDISVIDSHNPPLNPKQSIHVNDNKSNPQQ